MTIDLGAAGRSCDSHAVDQGVVATWTGSWHSGVTRAG